MGLKINLNISELKISGISKTEHMALSDSLRRQMKNTFESNSEILRKINNQNITMDPIRINLEKNSKHRDVNYITSEISRAVMKKIQKNL